MANNPTTSNRTNIVLSFAMADHGGQFAHWLRDKLMKKFNYFGVNNVYMDCVASRALKTHHSMSPVAPTAQIAGETYVSPDNRPQFAAQGYKPIGAMNSDWNKMYEKAMSEAHAMIMVITSSYLASEWCLKEWSQFQEERRTRPAFKGIGILFRDTDQTRLSAPNGKPIDQTGIRFITCTKTRGGAGQGLLWHPDDFGISESDLATLYSYVGNR
jgi:TIR domain